MFAERGFAYAGPAALNRKSAIPHTRVRRTSSPAAFKRQLVLARDSMLSPVRPSVRLSVCLSVTRVDQSQTVELRVLQFSPYSSPIPLLFAV